MLPTSWPIERPQAVVHCVRPVAMWPRIDLDGYVLTL